MTLPPNVHDAEPIPEAARAEIDALLQSGDLFRYTAPDNAPVSLLEAEFAALMGSKYALAVSSCSAALFLALKALDLPKGAKVLIPAFTFAAVPSSVIHADCEPVLVEVAAEVAVWLLLVDLTFLPLRISIPKKGLLEKLPHLLSQVVTLVIKMAEAMAPTELR